MGGGLMSKPVIANKNEKVVMIIALVVAVLSAFSAILGFVDEGLYGAVIETGVFVPDFMPGTVSQDIVAIASAVLMFVLVIFYLKRKDMRVFIAIIGVLTFYAYGYGLYVISALYTQIYFVYMIIFTLALFGIVLGKSGYANKDIENLYLPKWVRIYGAAFLLLIVFIFVVNWVGMMMPYIQSNTRPDFYAVFILDLCIIMPLFAVISYMLIKNNKLAYILLGMVLPKNIALILSVLIGEITAPMYGLENDGLFMVISYSAVVIVSSLLLVFYCLKIKQCTPVVEGDSNHRQQSEE